MSTNYFAIIVQISRQKIYLVLISYTLNDRLPVDVDRGDVCWRDELHGYPDQALDGVRTVHAVRLPHGHCANEPAQRSSSQ